MQRTRISNQDGEFTLPALAPGSYNIQVDAEGFQRLLQEDVAIEARLNLSLHLKVTAGSSAGITVAPPMGATQDAAIAGPSQNQVIADQIYSAASLANFGKPATCDYPCRADGLSSPFNERISYSAGAPGHMILAAAQIPAAPQAPAASVTPAQPSLTVDRDPAPSPDPDPPPTPITDQQGSALGSISRQGGKYTLIENAYEVRLNATVLDSSGRSIQTLGQDAFHVYEDGVPQTIASFRHEDLPVSLGILIDSSGSMYDKRTAVDEASLDFVKLSNPQDEAFLVDFSWEAFIDQDFTSDITKLQQGLSYIKSSGGTAIYDALVASADYLSKNAHRPKQVLLVITDGEDNASSATLEQAIRRIQDFDGPVIYCVGLLFGDDTNKGEARHAKRVLETLAEQTGGAAYFPKSVKEVDAIAKQVAEDIRTQYTIAYRSTKSPTLGGYRQVHVEAKEKGFSKLSVRTRTGYYPRTANTASKSIPATDTP